ncbi:MAG: hypothetical protein V1772_13850, partial [Chloroflexota bacterium]
MLYLPIMHRPPPARHGLWRAALMALLLAAGCARTQPTGGSPVRVAGRLSTASPPIVGTVVFRSATPPPTATPVLPAATPAHPVPTPTPGLVAITFGDGPVQYWADPNNVSALAYVQGEVWAATAAGVSRWSADGQLRRHTPADGLASLAIQGLAVDGDGHIWVGHADQPAWSEFDGTQWHAYAARRDAVATRYAALLRAQLFDPRLWVARADSTWVGLPSGDGGIESYDGARWRVYTEYYGVSP